MTMPVTITCLSNFEENCATCNRQLKQNFRNAMDGDCQASCQDGRDAVLLRNNACLGIQGLQQVRQASADAVSLRQGVTLAIGRSSLGVAHGVDAVFSRHIRFVLHRRSCSHIDLAIRDGRVHEAQLAQEQPNACARSQREDHGPE